MAGNVALEPGRTAGGFEGRTVLSFESRRSAEIAKLIETYGGRAMVAPATREVPAASDADVSRFVTALLEGRIDLVIFLTGVGTRALARAVEPFCSRDQFLLLPEQSSGCRPRSQAGRRSEGAWSADRLERA